MANEEDELGAMRRRRTELRREEDHQLEEFIRSRVTDDELHRDWLTIREIAREARKSSASIDPHRSLWNRWQFWALLAPTCAVLVLLFLIRPKGNPQASDPRLIAHNTNSTVEPSIEPQQIVHGSDGKEIQSPSPDPDELPEEKKIVTNPPKGSKQPIPDTFWTGETNSGNGTRFLVAERFPVLRPPDAWSPAATYYLLSPEVRRTYASFLNKPVRMSFEVIRRGNGFTTTPATVSPSFAAISNVIELAAMNYVEHSLLGETSAVRIAHFSTGDHLANLMRLMLDRSLQTNSVEQIVDLELSALEGRQDPNAPELSAILHVMVDFECRHYLGPNAPISGPRIVTNQFTFFINYGSR
jgi:hypothetical protein